jgi:hypothetical protein
MRQLGVVIDYRPGGVSMTNENFARLEYDRRMNAERVLFLLANVNRNELFRLGIPGDDGEPSAKLRQVQMLDKRIDEMLAAHQRITQRIPSKSAWPTDSERQYINALRAGGMPLRYIEDSLHDLRDGT